MEERIYTAINRIRNTKEYGIITMLLFPVLIVFFTFAKVNKGLDITDSAYSCTNYLFLDKLDGMWYYSTFYANLIGGILIRLPFGTTFLGLNIYTGLFKLALALSTYYFFTRAVGVEKELVFLGVIVSVALSWCPTTILYNYLTYLFFSLSAMFMYLGLSKGKRKYLYLAGFVLGCNFFVRLPNITEVGLIVALWIYSAAAKESLKLFVQKTFKCILGYATAFIPGVLLIKYTRGVSEYYNGVVELFSMTKEATSYSSVDMVASLVRQYAETWKYTEMSIFCLLLCLLVFLVLPEKLTWLRYTLASIVTGIFLLIAYRKGIVDLNFHWFGPVYRFGVMVLSLMIVWFTGFIFSRRNDAKEKLLAAIALVIICITPLGSNNSTYANINNMFFVLPVFLYQLVRFIGTNEYFRGVRYSIMLIILCWSLLCIKFGFTYVYRDGLEEPMDTYVKNNSVMVGMKTTAENAKNLTELNQIWIDNGLSNGTVLLYGDVCGLGFYLNTPVAISTAWPSLDSFSALKFSIDMKELVCLITEKGLMPPTIIYDHNLTDESPSEAVKTKQGILKEFIENFDYKEIYSNEVLTVLTVSE